jgi:ankyrin repeat protein
MDSTKCLVITSAHPCYRVFDAIQSNKLRLVLQMIVKLRTINVCDKMGVSLLHFAVMTQRVEIAKELIALRASWNTYTFHQHRSPLYSAYLNGNTELIKILIDAGAKCVPDKTGYFPR